ncbi:hypothetical protein FB466_0710 [Klugiella xanthotipulae]|uniref:Uncharacterized protein n=1 Tax=Klugiella xanthotipulae TaxID=244735 RepID=A0A543I5Z9_9MICO|nr:hypothetical protein FB466_0710 [Klugiella xanthotipulae]
MPVGATETPCSFYITGFLCINAPPRPAPGDFSSQIDVYFAALCTKLTRIA